MRSRNGGTSQQRQRAAGEGERVGIVLEMLWTRGSKTVA